ncbi:hypothetical protein [Streptomyces sp. NPDC048172]|uniref:terpene synthase family protein n=1 Tax=Streptomyces sp. NPDC048172 TaxID=3365505 RepID=UPI00371F6712
MKEHGRNDRDDRDRNDGAHEFPWPVLRLPFPAARNPYALRLGSHLVQWVTEFGLFEDTAAVERFAAVRYEDLLAAVYPTANAEDLELISELIIWMYLFDDQFDIGCHGRDPVRARAIAADVAAVVHGGGVPKGAGPLLTALASVRNRVLASRSPLWPRLADDLTVFATAVAREVRQRAAGHLPSLAEYTEQRLDTFAWGAVFDLIELEQGGATVPDRLRAAPEYRALVRTAGLVMCVMNDLISLGKEIAGQEEHNLVLLMARNTGQSLQQAIRAAERLFAHRVEEYLSHAGSLSGMYRRLGATPAERAVVDGCRVGMEYMMRGELDWCRTTLRYAQGKG